MKVKRLSIILIFAIFLLVAFSPRLVYATWNYPDPSSIQNSSKLNMNVGVFVWEGADDLPQNDNVGQDHVALIERITQSEYGMNNPSSFLSQYIEDRINDEKDTVSSVAPTPGGNLKDLFSTSAMRALDFMMHLHLDANGNILFCEIFTFSTSLVGNTIGATISPVYKTELEYRNNAWLPKYTQSGSAKTMKYDAKQGGTRITISPASWVRNAT